MEVLVDDNGKVLNASNGQSYVMCILPHGKKKESWSEAQAQAHGLVLCPLKLGHLLNLIFVLFIYIKTHL